LKPYHYRSTLNCGCNQYSLHKHAILDVALPMVHDRLHCLGWENMTLDYRSMQFAAFCMDDR
jgi:hypothetical protein